MVFNLESHTILLFGVAISENYSVAVSEIFLSLVTALKDFPFSHLFFCLQMTKHKLPKTIDESL